MKIKGNQHAPSRYNEQRTQKTEKENEKNKRILSRLEAQAKQNAERISEVERGKAQPATGAGKEPQRASSSTGATSNPTSTSLSLADKPKQDPIALNELDFVIVAGTTPKSEIGDEKAITDDWISV